MTPKSQVMVMPSTVLCFKAVLLIFKALRDDVFPARDTLPISSSCGHEQLIGSFQRERPPRPGPVPNRRRTCRQRPTNPTECANQIKLRPVTYSGITIRFNYREATSFTPRTSPALPPASTLSSTEWRRCPGRQTLNRRCFRVASARSVSSLLAVTPETLPGRP